MFKLKNLTILLFILCMCNELTAQKKPVYKSRKKKPASSDAFSGSQFWVGIRTGINKAKGQGSESYSNYASLSGSSNNNAKTYDKFGDIGWSLGLEATYEIQLVSFSFLPKYSKSNFGYSWGTTHTGSSAVFTQNYTQQTELQSFTLPLQVRARFLDGNFVPSVFAGGYVDIVSNSTAILKKEDIYSDFSGTSTTETPLASIDISDKFLSANFGVYGGIGINYALGSIHIGLDASYAIGLSNMADETTRFNDNRLNNIDGVLDDFKIQKIQLELSVVVPTKFFFDGSFKKVKN